MAHKSISVVLTTICLLMFGVIVLLVLVLIQIKNTAINSRYEFAAHETSREIYVFDRKTANVYVTSPETIGKYQGEMWALLNPLKKGNALEMNDFIEDTKGRKLRAHFLQDAKEEPETDQP